MKKNIGTKLLVSALLIFLTITSYGQESGKPSLTPGESFYLLKYGITDSYKWDNNDANSIINLTIKNRKTSNTLMYGGAGLALAALVTRAFIIAINQNGFSSSADALFHAENIIPASIFVAGGLTVAVGGIMRTQNKKSLQVAKMKISGR
jgi:hypothetical protein